MAEMFLTFCLKLGVQLGMSFSVMEKKQNFIYKTITIMSSLHWDENDDTCIFSANDELQCPSIPSSHQRKAHNLRSTIMQFLVCC